MKFSGLFLILEFLGWLSIERQPQNSEIGTADYNTEKKKKKKHKAKHDTDSDSDHVKEKVTL